MPHLKHPLRSGGRWLRQATVVGLGIGLLAGTGLIATASAASAHPGAARTSAGRHPAGACAVVVGRRGQVRFRKRCLAVRLVPAPACRIELLPGSRLAPVARSVRLAPAKRPVVLRLLPGKRGLRELRVRPGKAVRLAPVKGPVAVRLLPGKGRLRVLRLAPGKAVRLVAPKRARLSIRARGCAQAPVLRPDRPLVRICRVGQDHGRVARCCAMAPRVQRLAPRAVKLKLARPGRLGKSVRIRLGLATPVQACAIALPLGH